MAGAAGVPPFIDLMYADNERDEAIMMFFKASDAMVGKYVSPATRLSAEKGLYIRPELLDSNGVVAEYGPFRIILVSCEGCTSPLLN